MQKYLFLLFGTLFGFILSRAGATTYDYYAQLFLFQDLQLLWVILVAGGVGALGVMVLKRFHTRAVLSGEPIAYKGKPYKQGFISGALLFGMGWGLAGACPGTALAMLGEGKLGAGFTIFGMVLGTFLYGIRAARSEQSKEPSEPLQPMTDDVAASPTGGM